MVYFCYITCKDAHQAKHIGKTLVTQRLAACANILPQMTSFYHWQGELQEDQEAVLICKTSAEQLDALTEAVKALHSYELPCVIALPVQHGNAAYLHWILAESQPPQTI